MYMYCNVTLSFVQNEIFAKILCPRSAACDVIFCACRIAGQRGLTASNALLSAVLWDLWIQMRVHSYKSTHAFGSTPLYRFVRVHINQLCCVTCVHKDVVFNLPSVPMPQRHNAARQPSDLLTVAIIISWLYRQFACHGDGQSVAA